MTDLRIECPECGTSFRTDTLKLKTGQGDKAIVQCFCGKALEASFTETPQGQRRNWYGRKVDQPAAKSVTVNVTESL